MNEEKNRFIRYRKQKINEGCVRVNLWISKDARNALDQMAAQYHKTKSSFIDGTLLTMLRLSQKQEQTTTS